jgi:hypothetical protein
VHHNTCIIINSKIHAIFPSDWQVYIKQFPFTCKTGTKTTVVPFSYKHMHSTPKNSYFSTGNNLDFFDALNIADHDRLNTKINV